MLLAFRRHQVAVRASQVHILQLRQPDLFDYEILHEAVRAVDPQVFAHPLFAQPALVALLDQLHRAVYMVRVHAVRLHSGGQIETQRTDPFVAGLQFDAIGLLHLFYFSLHPLRLVWRLGELLFLVGRKIELRIVFWLPNAQTVDDKTRHSQKNDSAEGRTQLDYESRIGSSLLLPAVLDVGLRRDCGVGDRCERPTAGLAAGGPRAVVLVGESQAIAEGKGRYLRVVERTLQF